MKNLTVCAVQMTSGKDWSDNLQDIDTLLSSIDLSTVDIVVLPEMFAVFGVKDQTELARQESEFSGPVGTVVRAWARRHQVWIVAGTVPCMTDDDSRPKARCHVLNSEGELVSWYDKIHLFDAQVADRQGAYRESDSYSPGHEVVSFDSPWGRVGLAVCYDLRFAELFRELNDQGAEVVIVPAAFTAKTGAAHWQVLCRARAIENGYFVFAVNQAGQHDEKRETYGHSMLVDPWGDFQSLNGEKTIQVFRMDLDQVPQIRQQIPVNENRRL